MNYSWIFLGPKYHVLFMFHHKKMIFEKNLLVVVWFIWQMPGVLNERYFRAKSIRKIRNIVVWLSSTCWQCRLVDISGFQQHLYEQNKYVFVWTTAMIVFSALRSEPFHSIIIFMLVSDGLNVNFANITQYYHIVLCTTP